MSRRVMRGVIVMMVDRVAMRVRARRRAANSHDKSDSSHKKRPFHPPLYADAGGIVKSAGVFGLHWSSLPAFFIIARGGQPLFLPPQRASAI